MFASTNITSQDLEAFLGMPWHKGIPTTSTTQPLTQPTTHPQSQAKISALLLQASAPVLGLHDLTSSDLNSKQGSSRLLHTALQDSDPLVQAAAIVLLPVMVANTAEAAKGSARGQPTVGVRLLQKGLDRLSDIMHQGNSMPDAIKLALAHSLEGFVSMQAVAEHRVTAMCNASEALLVICQCGRTNTTGKDSSTISKAADGWFTSLSGLHCWPAVKQQNLHALPVTGHGGASLPVKAIRSFADVLLSAGHEDPRGLAQVSRCLQNHSVGVALPHDRGGDGGGPKGWGGGGCGLN